MLRKEGEEAEYLKQVVKTSTTQQAPLVQEKAVLPQVHQRRKISYLNGHFGAKYFVRFPFFAR